MNQTDLKAANRRTFRRLLLMVAGMFAFVFALVPMYDVLCEITGLNGKTSNTPTAASMVEPDLSRTVMVEFVASVNEAMPWEFRPEVIRMEVHPGKTYRTSFYARNPTDSSMTGQAIPSVSPGQAARHFKKTECFCFTEQLFEAGEGRDMPLLFMVDPELPRGIEVLTLAYTFFDKHKTTN
ncbi:MAG: cytochrome c oxidase assembly protein [Thiogranum sp.]|nr:cytochrome c oxidase assembly protein [Thiogranum sp.]